MLEVFGREWLDKLHVQVAYSNQKSTIEWVTRGTYEEDSRQIHAIRWNPGTNIYQCRANSDSEMTIPRQCLGG
jgi:hypothetical protein